MKRIFVITMAVFLTSVVSACGGSDENTKDSKPVNTLTTKTETPVSREDSTKTEMEPVIEEIPLDAQRDFYIKTTKPEIDHIVDEFDFIWETLWTYTFQSVTDGKITSSEAWKKLDTAKKRYDLIYQQTGELPTDGLDKELKKKLGSFQVEIEDAIAFRLEAIKKAKKMFDKGEFPASEVNDIQDIVDQSGDYFLQGILYLTDIENTLGIEN
ncbi:hypothetical protein [Paenibacillus residui]|uniref:Lipoprotein n=1 Tax=Paenibacillus residui TaxID=629724 RepID=A0ABW3D643_9BACL